MTSSAFESVWVLSIILLVYVCITPSLFIALFVHTRTKQHFLLIEENYLRELKAKRKEAQKKCGDPPTAEEREKLEFFTGLIKKADENPTFTKKMNVPAVFALIATLSFIALLFAVFTIGLTVASVKLAPSQNTKVQIFLPYILLFSLLAMWCIATMANHVFKGFFKYLVIIGGLVYGAHSIVPGNWFNLPHPSFLSAVNYQAISLVEIFAPGSTINTENGILTSPSKLAENIKSLPSLGFSVLIIYTLCKFSWELNRHLRHIKGLSDDHGSTFDRKPFEYLTEALLWAVAFVMASALSGADLIGLGLFSGLVGAGLSISFRDLLGNFVSGIFLHWDRSAKRHDTLQLEDGRIGRIAKTSLRYTILRTPDDIDIMVPNSYLVAQPFENLTRTKNSVRLVYDLEVSDEENVGQIQEIIETACKTVEEVGSSHKIPAAFYHGTSKGVHKFGLRFWVSTPEKGPGKLTSEVAYVVQSALEKANVKMGRHAISTDARHRRHRTVKAFKRTK